MSLINKAKDFAKAAHEGQIRKYTGQPYISHPKSVAKLVEMVGGTEEMIAAAWLHDVVEDCDVKIGTIENEFGKVVASYVLWLSDMSMKLHGNRAVRKSVDASVISHAPQEVKTVKVADIIDNSKSIMQNDPQFAKVYLREKAMLLSTSLKDANPELLRMAWDILLG